MVVRKCIHYTYMENTAGSPEILLELAKGPWKKTFNTCCKYKNLEFPSTELCVCRWAYWILNWKKNNLLQGYILLKQRTGPFHSKAASVLNWKTLFFSEETYIDILILLW